MSVFSQQLAAVGWGRVAALVMARLGDVAGRIVGHAADPERQSYNKPSSIIGAILDDLFASELSDEALVICWHLLRRPRLSVDVVAAVAATLLKHGQLELAETFCRVGLRRFPSSPSLLCCLGVVRYLQGRTEDALLRLQLAISLRPSYAEALSNLGNIYLASGDVSQAVCSYQSALRSDPCHIDALLNLGNALQQLGFLEDAVEAYQQVLRLRPSFVPALSNLGTAYQRMGQAEQAIGVYGTAIAFDPNFSDAWSNLGLSLQSISRHDDALCAFEKALSLDPLDSRYRCNLANCCLELGRLDAALGHYKNALDMAPLSHDYRLSFAIALLLYSNCRDGWEFYEARLTDPVISGLDPGQSRCPQRWQTSQGRLPSSVFLACEQGLGDTLHFCRYAKYLADQGVDITMRVQAPLIPILSSSNLGVRLLEVDQSFDWQCDFWSPLLSLPLILGVSEARPLISSPYLSVSSAVVRAWAKDFSTASMPVVAINWQGNPAAEVNNLKGRSIPLQEFNVIAESVPVQFVAVQHGEAYGQLESIAFRDRFVDFQDKVGPCCGFENVAGVIANSLLLITSDTAVAHLSAAAGFETWLLLHAVPDWRWGMSGETTFWYPSVRLFRQTKRGDWGSVMAEVAAALAERISTARIA